MSRSNTQVRYGTCFHEAGHLVGAHRLGFEVGDVEIMSEAGELVDGVAGHVVIRTPIDGLHAAEDHTVVILAGEAATRAAWRLGVLDAELLGVKTVEPTVADLLAVPPDASPAAKAVYGGWNDLAHHNDQVNASALVQEWTSSDLEASTLLAYCRARASALVEQELTLRLVSNVAEVLLDEGGLSAERATDLLQRWELVFDR